MSGEPSAQTPATASQATERERWELVQRLFYAAIDVSPASRDGFVRRACEGDAALEAEVKALIEADLEAGDYMEQPLVDAASLAALFEAPLAPGDVLCDRFEIVRSIAEGGMGHVFEALDRELNVRVALKVIRPEIAAVPEALARFRQEVRLARTITHPNVCRTFDIDRELRTDAGGRQYEIVFLTMELLAGETLASRIARSGALKLDETLELARQMAAALDAAHALGVVHRDMKPANVMLVPMGDSGVRAVITDFGLARIDPVLQAGNGSVSPGSLGKTGQPIGTLAYMAPEQLEAGAVSPATDVYGFGLILFEMVTGRRAFPSENLLSGLTQRLTGAPPPPRAFAANLPPHWNYAIESCLQVKPSERPQRAGQVAAVLEGRRGRFGMLRKRVRAGMRTKRGRWIAAAAAMVLGVSLFAGGVRLYDRAAKFDLAEKVAPGALVYLAPVKNETGEARLDNVTELLEAGLAQSAQINLLDQGKVGDILEHMTKPPDTKIDPPVAREIAMRAGAVRVVFATLTGSPSSGGQRNYKLQMEVQQPDNTPTLFRKSVKRTFAWTSAAATAASTAIPPELLSAVRDASDWVRHEAGESAGDIARLDVPPEDVTTSSWEALADYTEALRLSRQQRFADAIVALHDAVRLDPRFALADAALADVEFSLHDDTEGFEAYRAALDPGLERRLSRRERDRIKGMDAIDSWDYSTAVDSFRDYESFYPNDETGWVYPVVPLVELGRSEEAIADLKRAKALDPDNQSILYSLVGLYTARGETQMARDLLSQVHGVSDAPLYATKLGEIAFLEGDYDRANKLFRSLRTSSDLRLRSHGFELLADLEADQGHLEAALAALNAGIVEDAAQGNFAARSWKLASRAAVKANLGDYLGSSDDLDMVLKAKPSPASMLFVETVLGQAIQSASGERSSPLRRQMLDLERNLPTADYGPVSQILAMRTHAEAALARGELRRSLELFRELSAVDAPASDREYLGRALSAVVRGQPRAPDVLQLRSEASTIYGKIALHPESIWKSPYTFPPGFFAGALAEFIRLSEPFAAENFDRETARRLLASLHRLTPPRFNGGEQPQH